MDVRTRFAPSPTGFLHIGNIRTALFNFLYARHAHGKFLLRIEDTDFERSKQEYADGVMEDLQKLGLHWDEGPFYQSKRLDQYEEALAKLKSQDRVYLCYCTGEELEARRKEALLMKRPPKYDNRCRSISKEEIAKRIAQGIKPTVRFKVDETESVLVQDLIRGDVHFHPQEMGDFVIMRTHPEDPKRFLPTFHLSVCVDDGLMKVTHVIRGEDHLSNSPRHVLLFKALGYSVPTFAHLSLIHGPGGEPLSKRLTSVRVRDFVDKNGYLVEGLLNYLSLLGWSPKDDREVLPLADIIKLFDPADCTKHPAIFNEEKLEWINSEHLRAMAENDYCEKAVQFLKSNSADPRLFANTEKLSKSLLLIRTDIKKFSEVADRLNFLPEPDFANLPADEKKVLAEAGASEVIKAATATLSKLSGEGEGLFDQFVAELKKVSTQKGKSLFMPVRIAVTGHVHGPELKKVFGILDRQQIEKRFQECLKQMSS